MPDIRLSPGGIIPREMTARQWDTYTRNAKADYYRSGQTNYDDGTGFWIGIDTDGTPKFSIGNSAGNKLTWNGTTLSVTGALNFTNSVQTFTPTWSGFSVAPTGNINYIDFGAFVMMWTDSTIGGTSNATDFSFSGLPAGIRPSAPRVIAAGAMFHNSTTPAVGEAQVSTSGTVTLGVFRTDAVANLVIPVYTGWVNSGNKGLTSGWFVQYSK